MVLLIHDILITCDVLPFENQKFDSGFTNKHKGFIYVFDNVWLIFSAILNKQIKQFENEQYYL